MDWNNYLFPENEQPLDRLVGAYSRTSIFRTIAFIGDSLSSGEFETRDEEGKAHYHDLYEYSWGQYIARKNGLKAYNFSKGGMTGKQYIESFVTSFRDSLNGEESFILKTYETVAPYVLSDCSINTLSNMLSRYSAYTINRIVTPEGENILGDTYYEFYLDEEKLDPLILDLFYAPK